MEAARAAQCHLGSCFQSSTNAATPDARLPVRLSDMKPSHRPMPVQIFAERSCGIGCIDEANGIRLGLSAIRRDFRAAQRTGPIIINSRGRLIRHYGEISPYKRKIIGSVRHLPQRNWSLKSCRTSSSVRPKLTTRLPALGPRPPVADSRWTWAPGPVFSWI